MSTTVGDYLLERLAQWGVHRIYGYPGDGINGIIGALDRAGSGIEAHGSRSVGAARGKKQTQGKAAAEARKGKGKVNGDGNGSSRFAEGTIEFVQTRHEEMAAFMACAHAKFTGEVGVCLATSGPGAIHLLNGLYDAKLDHQPVVAIVGQQARGALGGDYQQEVDLISLFKDVAHEYVHMASSPVQVRHLVDRAMRIAKAERTVTCLILPNDVQEMDAVETPPRKHGTVHSGAGHTTARVIPRPSDLKQAADVLNAGKRVAMLVGAGALHATDEVIEVAELLGAGVAKALLGKAALPDDLPFVTGSIGLLGTKPSWELMDGCDTLLMVGTSFPYSEFLPEEGQARGVQIDIDARMLSLRYPMEVNLIGDSAETLRELIPLLQRKTDSKWRESIEREVADWWQVLEGRAMNTADPINPQRVFWDLSQRLPDNCIITCDSGSSANWYARDVKIRRGMLASLSGGLATMGPAVPYAIAAKFAYPDRPVIAAVGDGSMQMNGNAELLTAAKYWRHWSDPRLVVLVLNNRDLNQVTWEQRAMAGDPKFEGSQNVPDFPYAEYAELIGFKGIRVDEPEQIGAAWDEAFAADRPVVLEAYTDGNVPPLPPHIKLKQAKAYASALLSRDPESLGIIRQSLREMRKSWMPGKGASDRS